MATGADRIVPRSAMASPWRRRPLCTLVGTRAAPAALLDVSGRGALLATSLAPPPGSRVALHHPDAGSIAATVLGSEPVGLHLRFDGSAAAVAFALAAIAADMSRAE